MSDIARRWLLCRAVGQRDPWTTIERLSQVEGDGLEMVAVREDAICDADVEAVAKRLAERDLGGEEIVGPICEGFKDEARTLLALILGSVEHGF
jgi:hypothetical protein